MKQKLEEMLKQQKSLVDLLGVTQMRATKDEPHDQQSPDYKLSLEFVWQFYLSRLQVGSAILGAVVAVIAKIIAEHR